MGNCPPTPPLSQQFALSVNVGFIVGWGERASGRNFVKGLLVCPGCLQSPIYRVIIEFDRQVREIVIFISYSYTSNVLIEGAERPFGGRKCSEMYLKTHRSVITP